ncbi:MAG: phosphate ABC transporter ATP-binding protein [Nanoarchaeota archaeon]|nr:phosphate ABC transporter ATP-binding protein [Nanoarchaeota archaeon]MBU1321087.1 phosphate ABC transporter ATP-binding protein [Nanoarchaeota archaeon]MBU1598287.1 phosphate ABC transporter ATP-binding protein [Nanoarchaeota archaeon]MBU2441336.1 phosphate ABC transporter ATP-binding protein [Nanoarchaeota archaeon]
MKKQTNQLIKQTTKIKFKHLNFWYNGKQILYDVTLDMYKNQITALIGPSGCGKSTLIRCINRMNDLIAVAKAKGEIRYNDENIFEKEYDVVKLRKKIGMVFQKPNPFPMSIFENVAYGLRVDKLKDKKKLRKIVEDSLKKAELWEEVKDRLDLSAFRLSGGQQQRLCIARALAINPDVILLDEPCSALDPIATAKIESLLLKLKKEMTIVIVTHNMQQAKRISDHAIYLLNGKVIEYSQTTQMFENPQDNLTKDYW